MKMNKYTVNNGVKNIGPLDFQTILEMVTTDKLKATDQLYLQESNQWILICQHPDFVSGFKSKSTPSSIQTDSRVETVKLEQVRVETEVEALQTDSTWYVLKGENKEGPFPYLDVVKMLQQKIIFEYDYVWRQGMEAWARVAQVHDFSPNQVRGFMKSKEAKNQEVFFRRKFIRIPYKCEIVVHDNSSLWKGHTVELGEGGAGIVIQNSAIMPGQNVYIHFRPGQKNDSFNVLCEVVSKKYLEKVRNKNSTTSYGMKFINLSKNEKDSIKAISLEAA